MGKEYHYIRGNTVINPKRDYDTVEKNKKQEKNKKVKKTKKKSEYEVQQRRRVSVLQVVAIMAVLGLITIWRFSTIYEMQNGLSKIREDIKVSTDLAESLKVDLLKYASLDMIQSKAQGNLKMISPDKNSTVTVDITKNYFEKLTEKEDNKLNSKSIFSRLKDALMN